MSSSEITAGKAFLRLLVDDKEFAKGLDAGIAKLKDFSNSAIKLGAAIGGVGAAITAPFAASLGVFAQVGSELNDMSERTGVSVEKLSALKYAAEQSGASLEAVEKALRYMAKNGQDVNTFDEVAKKIAAIEDPSRKAEAAMKAWGKSGAGLIPMIQTLDETTKKATALGLIWGKLATDNADALGDAFDTLKAQGVALAAAIANTVAPALTAVLDAISESLPTVIEFVKQNKELIVIVAAVGVTLSGLGAVLAATGAAAYGTAAAIGALRVALALLSKHPIAAVITLALAAVTAAVGPLVYKWLDLSDAMDTSTNATNQAANAQTQVAAALAGTNDQLEEGNKKLDKRAELLAKLSPLDRQWLNIADERKAKQARDLELIDAQIRANDELIHSMTERGDVGTMDLRRAEARRDSLRQQRALTAAPDPLSEEEKKRRAFAEEQARRVREQQEAFKATQEKQRQSQQERFDNIRSQLDSFSRPIRGGYGGQFAEQIGGSTAAQATEERTLKLTQQILDTLKAIERKPFGLMTGPS